MSVYSNYGIFIAVIHIFADGACSGNPGPGGWGAIILTPDDKVTEIGGHVEHTTNNKMELTAVGKALRLVEEISGPVSIYTDSKYVIQGITEWAKDWEKKKWKKADGKAVLNEKFWKRLLEITRARKDSIEWHYVKGHSGHSANDRCDEIAVAFSKKKSVDLYRGDVARYGIDLSLAISSESD